MLRSPSTACKLPRRAKAAGRLTLASELGFPPQDPHRGLFWGLPLRLSRGVACDFITQRDRWVSRSTSARGGQRNGDLDQVDDCPSEPHRSALRRVSPVYTLHTPQALVRRPWEGSLGAGGQPAPTAALFFRRCSQCRGHASPIAARSFPNHPLHHISTPLLGRHGENGELREVAVGIWSQPHGARARRGGDARPYVVPL